MKRIVAHHSPDIDAIASIWLIHRHLPRWKNAPVELVSAGRTLNDMVVDSDPDTIHVDTGMGRFDHHDTPEFTSATRRVFDYLVQEGHIKEQEHDALERIVDVVTRYDHFHEAELEDADDDMHLFSLAYIIFGLRTNATKAQELIQLGEDALDGILQYMKSKVHAEHIIEKGFTTNTKWGKTLVLETDNDRAMKVAFIKGYDMVIRYSPSYKNVAFKLHPKNPKTLKKLHAYFVKNDAQAQWFYHASGRVLLNASTRDTKEMVTKFSLKELLQLVTG